MLARHRFRTRTRTAIAQAIAAWSPSTLFASGEQGAWYDPSDLTLGNMYQDSAKATPVTAVEQPVGWIQDKSGRGNHAFQATSISRPTLSARVNLLTNTEDFTIGTGPGFWNAASVTTAISLEKVPGENTNAKLLYPSSTGTNRALYYGTLQTGVGIVSKVYIKKAGFRWVALDGNISYAAYFDLETGKKGTVASGHTADITPVGDDWYLCSVTNTLSGTMYSTVRFANADGSQNATASGTNGVYIWGADLRVANDGVGLPAYQRVGNVSVTPSDYDTVGFPQGDKFDGIDDFQITSAGGGGTSALFFCAAIRVGKVGAAQTLFSDTGTNTGYRVRINASNQIEFSAGNGSAFTTVATTATLGIGQRAVVTCWHDGVNLNAQINSGTVAQAAFATATAGTAQTTLGKDNNAASSFFMGSIYESIYVKDDVLSASQITSAQQYCATIGKITL